MRTAVAVVSLLALAACAQPSRDTYRAGEVGRPLSVSEATVVSSRVVKIASDPGVVGPGAGLATGASVGALAIGNGEGAALAGVLGGLLGAGAGYVAESKLREHDGIEYTLRGLDGRVFTLVQNRESGETPFPEGAAVLVQQGGSYTRIIEKPASLQDAVVNPPPPPASRSPAAPPGGYGTVRPLS